MADSKKSLSIADEIVVNRIIVVNGKKVMIDSDLAELYGVSTKRLNEQVKRNRKRFPKDFMFQLSARQKRQLVSNVAHLGKLKFSKTLPFVFTEHGAVMLASVLNSQRAIHLNVQIIRVFSKMREMLSSYKGLMVKIQRIEQKGLKHDAEIKALFQYLNELLADHSEPMRRIGFRHEPEG